MQMSNREPQVRKHENENEVKNSPPGSSTLTLEPVPGEITELFVMCCILEFRAKGRQIASHALYGYRAWAHAVLGSSSWCRMMSSSSAKSSLSLCCLVGEIHNFSHQLQSVFCFQRGRWFLRLHCRQFFEKAQMPSHLSCVYRITHLSQFSSLTLRKA